MLKQKDEWQYFSRFYFSELWKIPIGSKLTYLMKGLIYQPQIAYVQQADPKHTIRGALSMYRYVEPSEKRKYALVPEATRLPKEDFFDMLPKITANFMSLSEQLMAFQILGLFYQKKNVDKFIELDFGTSSYRLGISKKQFYTIVEKLKTIGILVSPKLGKYRLTTGNEKEDKKALADEMKAYKTVERKTPEKDLPNTFSFLTQLNVIVESVQKLQTLTNQTANTVAEITFNLSALNQTDKSIENSSITLLKLNSLYQEQRKQLEEKQRIIQQIQELLLSIKDEPMSGEVARKINMSIHLTGKK